MYEPSKENMILQGVVLTFNMRKFLYALKCWLPSRKDKGDDNMSAAYASEKEKQDPLIAASMVAITKRAPPEYQRPITAPERLYYELTPLGKKIFVNWLLHPEADSNDWPNYV